VIAIEDFELAGCGLCIGKRGEGECGLIEIKTRESIDWRSFAEARQNWSPYLCCTEMLREV